MKSDRAGTNLDDLEPASAWSRFWFTPIPLTGLHTLRVLAGLLFCAWLLSFAGHEREFFSLDGLFDRDAYLEAQRQNVPMAPVGWSILFLANSAAGLKAIYWGSIAVLLLFTFGVATRITSILSWVVVVSFLANPAISYEADYLLGILAFYLMLAYVSVGQWSGDLTPWERVLGTRHDLLFGSTLFGPPPRELPLSYAANGIMRLLQIHFAIIMATNGLHKLQIGYWWSGVALWFPLHPPFQTTAETLAREFPTAMPTLFVLSVLTYVVLVWEIGFPLFAWRTGKWRVLLLGGALTYWLGVFFVYKLPLFGPFVMLGALSFLTPKEWAWLAALTERILGTAVAGKTASAEAKKPPVMAVNENIKKL